MKSSVLHKITYLFLKKIMLYDWTQLGVKEITNLYLYGQAATPTDLTNEALIRPKDVSKIIRYGADIDVDMASYMSTGPGRFALGSESEVVQAFFSTVSDLSWMAAGVQYKKDDIISHLQLGVDSERISIKQVELSDRSGDYWQRSYIWNSGLFKLSDDVRFTVDAQGNRSINNYSIRAFNDDFDFEGGGLIADGANAVLEPQIDPWKIGRKVNITFVDTGLPTRTYTVSDLSADGFKHISHVISGAASLVTLPAGVLSIINELWVGGVTQTFYQSKPIIYGTVDADTISASQLDGLPLLLPLKMYGKSTPDKGVAIIAGGGNDDLIGSGNGDQLSGGTGDDILDGQDGKDYLEGNAANDKLIGGVGDDQLFGGWATTRWTVDWAPTAM